MSKEKELSPEQKAATVKEFNFNTGPDNVYDMRLVRHEDGWIYGLFCTEHGIRRLRNPIHPAQPPSAAGAPKTSTRGSG